MTKTELLEQILAELKAIHALLEPIKRGETFTMDDGNTEYEVSLDTLDKRVIAETKFYQDQRNAEAGRY